MALFEKNVMVKMNQQTIVIVCQSSFQIILWRTISFIQAIAVGGAGVWFDSVALAWCGALLFTMAVLFNIPRIGIRFMAVNECIDWLTTKKKWKIGKQEGWADKKMQGIVPRSTFIEEEKKK